MNDWMAEAMQRQVTIDRLRAALHGEQDNWAEANDRAKRAEVKLARVRALCVPTPTLPASEVRKFLAAIEEQT